MSKRKLLFISHSSSDKGGAELSMLETIKILADSYSISVVYPEEGPLIKLLDKFCDKNYVIKYDDWITKYPENLSLLSKFKFLIGYIRSSISIRGLIRNGSYDVIISNTISTPVGALSTIFSNKNHVWYIHEFGDLDHSLKFIYGSSISLSIINRLDSFIIFNSKATYDYFSNKLTNSNNKIIYYAMKPKASATIKSKSFSRRLVMVGRVAEGKNQLEAIKAVQELNSSYSYQLKLDIIGGNNSSYNQLLEKYIWESNLIAFITIHSFVEKPWTFYNNSLAALVCSKNEAFGRVTVEAMQNGVPVIGANSGGTAELIDDGKTGFLYESGNIESLKNKVIQLLNLDKEAYKKMSEDCFNFAHYQFSSERHLNEMKSVFK